MTVAPALCVVVPTVGRAASLERLLAAIDRQALAPDALEVVIVLDGADPALGERLRRRGGPYPLRVLARPRGGRAAAVNAGAAAATAPLLLLLDDDMEPAAGCAAAHLARHADGRPRAVLGAVPVRVGPDAPTAARYVAARFAAHEATLAAGAAVTPRGFYSGHLSLPRDVLRDVGGFDAGFRRYGNEDVDLMLRLRAAGVPAVYAAEAVALQAFEKDAVALVRDARDKGWTAVALAARHPRAAGESRLAAWDDAAPRRRVLRASLVRLDGRVPDRLRARVAPLLAAVVRRLDATGRLPAGVLDLLADVAFWCGARDALADDRGGRVPLGEVVRRSRAARAEGTRRAPAAAA